MTANTRIPQAEITGIYGAIVKRLSKKMLGEVPEPLGVMWQHKKVLKSLFGFSSRAEKWNECDPQLKTFAHMAAVSLVGCSFCLDLAYFQAHNESLDLDKAREVPRWRDSGIFTPLERDVMEYAEAVSQTPPTVTDDMSARLLEELGAPGLVELTAFVAAANLVSRNNTALGIKSQGFSAACGLQPLAEPTGAVRSIS
jgi:alkylhydroperoxidase family enzyme